jgi:hypothetical protein
VSTLVPRPSFAKTEPSEKLTRAVPDPIALKVIDIIVPAEPVYPEGNPPLKLIVPAPFENAGSATHRLKIELVRLTLTTVSSRGLKLTVPSAALIGAPAEFTITRTVKVLLLVYTPVLGEIPKVAAKARAAPKKYSPQKNAVFRNTLKHLRKSPCFVIACLIYQEIFLLLAHNDLGAAYANFGMQLLPLL